MTRSREEKKLLMSGDVWLRDYSPTIESFLLQAPGKRLILFLI